jgi:hypothetical protein
VPGDAAEPGRVLIIHFAGDGMAMPQAGRGNTGPQSPCRPKHGLVQAQRLEHLVLHEDLERLARDATDDLPEQDRVEVRVEDTAAGRDDRSGGEHQAERLG